MAGFDYGRYLEEFTAGEVIRHWPGRTVTEYDDTLFSMLTMNHHPLHIDANYGEHTQMGQRLVDGLFTISLVVGMTVRDISGKCIANLDYEKISHDGPVFHGDTLYAESTVLEVRPSQSKPDRGVVYVETRAYNQRHEKVLTLRRHVLVPRRGHAVEDRIPNPWSQ